MRLQNLKLFDYLSNVVDAKVFFISFDSRYINSTKLSIFQKWIFWNSNSHHNNIKICCQNSHKTKIIITKIIITKLASRLNILNAGYCKNNFQKTSKCHEPKFLPLNNKTLSQSYRNHVLRTNIRKVFKGN